MEVYVRDPKVLIKRVYTLDGQEIADSEMGEVPKDMDDYAKLVIGDGNARVALSHDMGFKDFGNGVSVSVTLSLSCNQDGQTINNVVQMLGAWTREYCKQQLAIADQEYQKIYFQKYPEKAPLPAWKPQ